MPGNGIMPLYLAGRENYLNSFSKSLDFFEQDLPQNLLLFGLRGTGKTVLMRKFKSIIEEKGWVFVEREFTDEFCYENRFAEAIAADIVNSVSQISMLKRFKEKSKTAMNILKPKELSAYGVSYKPFYGGKRELLQDYLKKIFVENWEVFKKSNKKGLVLLYDEFHTIKDVKESKNFVLSSLLAALSYAQREGCKYYLVISGLPNLYNNIRKTKTYAERMFNFKETTNLSRDDCIKAITIPLKTYNFSFDYQLTDKIIEETKGYPYFIQFYGFFILNSFPKDKFDLRDLNFLKKDLIEELDIGFFKGRFLKATNTEKKILSAMAKIKDEITPNKIRKEIPIKKTTLSTYLESLIEKGLIYKIQRGSYAFSIPLFQQYLSRMD